MEERKRDVLPDVLKGFGIILMVLGHCIQSGSGQAYLEGACYFEDRWYQFIYSFHMPLFMVISGYYAWGSVQRAESAQDRKRMITQRFISLAIPNVAWKIIEFVYMFAAGTYSYHGFGTLLRDVCVGILTNFWFLWAVLYSFLLVCLMHYRLRDSVWIYVLIFAAMFFTPDGLGLNAYKYMLPYYLIGFYGNKNREKLTGFCGNRSREKLTGICRNRSGKRLAGICRNRNREKLTGFCREGAGGVLPVLVSGIVFLALVSFFDADSFIYLTGYKLIGKNYRVQLQIDVYRFLVGLCGVVFWILAWKALLDLRRKQGCGVKLLAYLGRRGFGIYIISCILVPYAVCPVTADWEPRYGVNLAETAVVLAVSVIFVEILRRIKWVCMLVGEK